MNERLCVVGEKVFEQMVEVLKTYDGYKFPVKLDNGWIVYNETPTKALSS